MLPTHTTKIPITEETRLKFLSERERTSLSQGTIIKYAKALGFLPMQSRLNSGILGRWFSGGSASAYEDEIKAILSAYASITIESSLPDNPHDLQLVLIDDVLGQELEELLSNPRQAGRRFMLKHFDAPDGLTENRMQRLAVGDDPHVQFNHLRFIRAFISR